MTVLERYESLINSDKYLDTRDHLPYLRSVAKGNVLEIGTDVGNSTTALLLGVKENGGHLTSVDIKDCSHLFNDPQWTFLCSDSTKFPFFDNPPFDVVFIDGDHSFEGASSDLKLAISYVNLGGLILMHDVLAPQFPGVRQAFDEVVLPKHIREGSWGLAVIQC
jgi:predicted O-methyltransferase YrrM